MADRMTEEDGYETVYATRGHPNHTACGRIVVDANEWHRLQRIETAARQTIVLLDETEVSRGLYHRLIAAVSS